MAGRATVPRDSVPRNLRAGNDFRIRSTHTGPWWGPMTVQRDKEQHAEETEVDPCSCID